MPYQAELLKQYTVIDHHDKHEGLIYRESENDAILKALTKDDIVLDTGAHIGSFSLAASSLCKKIYAYEPEHNNFELLKENMKINHIDNVEYFEEGISDKTETTTIWIDGERSMNATTFKKRTTTKSQEIQLIDFKDVLDRHPDANVLKIDVEGAEYPIFMKYFDLIADRFRIIAAEFHLDNVGEVTHLYDIDGEVIRQCSKREDLVKWRNFVELIKSRFKIIQQRNKHPEVYVDYKTLTVITYLRNGVDFITAVKQD